jgi:hypothetical protein
MGEVWIEIKPKVCGCGLEERVGRGRKVGREDRVFEWEGVIESTTAPQFPLNLGSQSRR